MSLARRLLRLAHRFGPGNRPVTSAQPRDVSFATIADAAMRPGTRSWLVARAVSLRAF